MRECHRSALHRGRRPDQRHDPQARGDRRQPEGLLHDPLAEGDPAAFLAWKRSIPWRPGQMLFFCECANIHIENVSLVEPPYWACFLHGCEDVLIQGVTIRSPRSSNGDGIDVDCCRRVRISNCDIDSCDDSITLRAYPEGLTRPAVCEHVVITNCVLKTGCNAVRLGVGEGLIRNVAIDNIVIRETNIGFDLVSRYESIRTAGVSIENVNIGNVILEVKRPLRIRMAASEARDEDVPGKSIRDIHFAHLQGTAEQPITLSGGSRAEAVSDISFADLNLRFKGPDEPFRMHNATGVRMHAVRLQTPGRLYTEADFACIGK